MHHASLLSASMMPRMVGSVCSTAGSAPTSSEAAPRVDGRSHDPTDAMNAAGDSFKMASQSTCTPA